MSEDARYVLYIANDARNPNELCPGSKVANSLAETRSAVLVQQVETLVAKKHALPPWLDGTPILVDTSTNAIRRGSAAVEALRASEPGPEPAEAFADVEPRSVEQEFAGDNKLTEADLARYIERRNATFK